MRRTTIAAALAATAALMAPAAASAAPVESFFLDSYRSAATSTNYLTSIGGSTLATNTTYSIELSGTISLWAGPNWAKVERFNICGTPDTAGPLYPSVGAAYTGPVGLDANFKFAAVQPKATACPSSMPVSNTILTISKDGGATWFKPTNYMTTGGSRKYTTSQVGGGFPLRIRLYDPAPADNYGRYQVKITR